MTPAENKALLRAAFDGLAEADATAFLDLMADDFSWIVEGQSKHSPRFEGKAEIAARSESAPSVGFGCADPPSVSRHLFDTSSSLLRKASLELGGALAIAS